MKILVSRSGVTNQYVEGLHTKIEGEGYLFVVGVQNSEADGYISLSKLLLDYDLTMKVINETRGASVIMTDKSPAIVISHVSDTLMTENIIDVTGVFESVNNKEIIGRLTEVNEDELPEVAKQLNQRFYYMWNREPVELITAGNISEVLNMLYDAKVTMRGESKTGVDLDQLTRDIPKERLDSYNEGKSLSAYRYEIKATVVQQKPEDRVMIRLPRVRDIQTWARQGMDSQAISLPNPVDLAHYEHEIFTSGVYHTFIQQDLPAPDFYNRWRNDVAIGFQDFDSNGINAFIDHDPDIVQGSVNNNVSTIYENEKELETDLNNMIKSYMFSQLPPDNKSTERVEQLFETGMVPPEIVSYFKELIEIILTAHWQHTGLVPYVNLYEDDMDSAEDEEEMDSTDYRAAILGDVNSYRPEDIVELISESLNKILIEARIENGASELTRMVIQLLRWGSRKISRLQLFDNQYLDMNTLTVTSSAGMVEELKYTTDSEGYLLTPRAFITKELSQDTVKLYGTKSDKVIVGVLLNANTYTGNDSENVGNSLMFLTLIDYMKLTKSPISQSNFCERFGIDMSTIEVTKFIKESEILNGELEEMKAEDLTSRMLSNSNVVTIVESTTLLQIALRTKKDPGTYQYLKAYVENGDNFNIKEVREQYKINSIQEFMKAVHSNLPQERLIRFNLFEESMSFLGDIQISDLRDKEKYDRLKEVAMRYSEGKFLESKKAPSTGTSKSSVFTSGSNEGATDLDKLVETYMTLQVVSKIGKPKGKSQVRLTDTNGEGNLGAVVLLAMEQDRVIQVLCLDDKSVQGASGLSKFGRIDGILVTVEEGLKLLQESPEKFLEQKKIALFKDMESYNIYINMNK